VVRRLLAFFPTVALSYPIKKWAAVLALFCSTIYLLLSGANVSTQRAYTMIAIMLIAVVMDRRALTMRNVALAALLVLGFAPEAVFQPGFQMSFAAAAALVGTYELLSQRQKGKVRFKPRARASAIRFVTRNLSELALTPLVAGMSTALFAAYHFYQIAPFGLLANMLAMPIVSLAVMPLAMLSVFLMPFGLELIALVPLDLALTVVVNLAKWVAQLGPSGATGIVNRSVLLFGTLALLLAALPRSKFKALSMPMAILALLQSGQRSVPDILIAENGRQIGVIHSGGELVLLRPNADKFVTGIWRKAFQISNAKQSIAQTGGKANIPRCDEFGCVMTKNGGVLAYVYNTAGLHDDCVQGDILVIPYHLPEACTFLPLQDRPLIIDRTILLQYGAQMLTIGSVSAGLEAKIPVNDSLNHRIRMNIERAYGGAVRPWTRHRQPWR
jgi:competence protein ComEC